MPGKVKVKVLAGRNLPVMDKGSDTTDAYVEIKLGNVTHKTDICRKSLNPQWNSSEWYRFEVDDAELQDEPLQLRLMDHDTYSANDAIGKVYITLNPLLLPEAQQHPSHANTAITHSGKGAVMSGWIPVFDTMHGIRGEVNVIVKVELFNDFNKFRQSSCGVQFFHSPIIPYGYHAQVIHGFVEELVINDDPEYQWIDKIRTPRASNEARQVAFLKLSGQVQRKIGLKALEMGANAVIGFRRCLDLEGDVGVVARGAGTAVSLARLQQPPAPHCAGAAGAPASPDTLAQQLRKYIDFLNTDNSDKNLNRASNLSNSQVANILNVLSPNKEEEFFTNPGRDIFTFLNSPSISEDSSMQKTNNRKNLSLSDIRIDRGLSTQSLGLVEETLDETPLKFLLQQEDMRHKPVKNSIARGIKNFKTSSQNMLAKKMSGLKSRRSESVETEDSDRLSLASFTSERSFKLPFTETRSDFKRKGLLRGKVPHIKRSLSGSDSGSAMAALLVRSVMQAHSSLDCIKESHESNSPMSTLRRASKGPGIELSDSPIEKSAPNLAIVVESAPESLDSQESDTLNPKLQFLSMDNISLNSDISSDKTEKLLVVKKRVSESCPSTPKGMGSANSFLKLPADRPFYGSSVSTNLSSDEYSSSEDEDNSEDISENVNADSGSNLDTLSFVVKSVLEHNVDGAVIAHMNEKLEAISPSPDLIISKYDESNDPHWKLDSNVDLDSPLNNDLHIDPDHLSPNYEPIDIVTELIAEENDNSIEKENVFIFPREDHDDLSKLKKKDIHESDSNIHHSDSHLETHHAKKGKGIKSHGMLDLALHTILMDKATTLTSCSPSSASPLSTTHSEDNTKRSRFHFPSRLFRRHTSEINPADTKKCNRKSSILSLTRLTAKNKKRTFSAGDDVESPGLINTAIQTMLMEKVNVIGEILTSSPIVGDEQHLQKRPSCVSGSSFLPSTENIYLSSEFSDHHHHHDIPGTPIPKTHIFDEMDFFKDSIKPSKSLSDFSKMEPHFSAPLRRNVNRFNSAMLTLPRETVLGSPFISLNDLLHLQEDGIRKDHQIASPEYTSEESLHENASFYIDNPMERNKLRSHQSNVNDESAKNNLLLLNKPYVECSVSQTSIEDVGKEPEEQKKKISRICNEFEVAFRQAHLDSTADADKGDVYNIAEADGSISIVKPISGKTGRECLQCEDSDTNIAKHYYEGDHEETLDELNLEAETIIQENATVSIFDYEKATLTKTDVSINELAKFKPQSNPRACAWRMCIYGRCPSAVTTVAECSSPRHTRADSHGAKPPPTTNLNINASHRRSSDSDLSITPKGNSLTAAVCGGAVLRPSMNQDSIDMLEYPFLTIVKFPPGFILHIGGAVAARSVKLLERVPNPEEPAPRDAWWSELRTEVRSHMRALRCNAVLAYQETTSICDDVCVLSATGTAAVIDLHPTPPAPHTVHSGATNPAPAKTSGPTSSGKPGDVDPARGELTQTSSLDRTDFEKNEQPNNAKTNSETHSRRRGGGSERCGPCHVPYSSGSVPYRVSVSKCALCKKGRVPSVVLCSVEPVEGLAVVGRGCLLQAVASRARPPARGEAAARDISDQLPFLEYELHRLLLAKLRVRGMNAIFGLKTTIAVGAGLVAAVGVGTGVLLAALGSVGGGPKLRAAPGDPKLLQALQQGLDDALQANKNVYQLHAENEPNGKSIPSDTEESDEELPDIELSSGNKDTCVLEVDDAEDLEVLKVLTEARPPAGLHVVNTQSVPGLLGCEGLVSVKNLQMFTQLWRARLAPPPAPLHTHFHRLLQSVYFKLRRMVPCAVCDLRFRLDLPEADEIQLVVTGMAVGLGEPPHDTKSNKITFTPPHAAGEGPKKEAGLGGVKKTESSEMIFTLEEEQVTEINGANKNNSSPSAAGAATQAAQNNGIGGWRPGVDMTPLPGVPGARVLRYLGNLDFIFVRESTNIRELGGLSGFLHSFITEVLAVVRAHVTALGGNAIVAFYMTELILSDNPHKNQAQCLVSVGGDVVFVSYFPPE